MSTTDAPSSTHRPRRVLPKPFDIQHSDGLLTLISAPDLNERSWAAWFGNIQVGLDERQWQGQNIHTCVIDFRDCTWADPLPLLSLALSLANFEAKGGDVQVILPEIKISQKDESSTNQQRERSQEKLEKKRLLKFMAREGFLDLLTRKQPVTKPDELSQPSGQYRKTKIGTQPLRPTQILEFREQHAPLAYEQSTCVPAMLLALNKVQPASDTSTLEDIDRWVLGTIQTRILPVVMGKVPAWAHRSLLYRMQILLRETLHNIAEHAYEQNGGHAGVYIRYREGRLSQTPSTWKAMEPYIEREDNGNLVALMSAAPPGQQASSTDQAFSFSITRAGFFEVFILDGGCGLVESLRKDESLRQILKSPNPLHKAMLAVFDGRSTKTDRPTEKGGLYLLRRLLEPSHDYLRARDKDTWWGRELPLPMTQSTSTPSGHFSIDCKVGEYDYIPIHGLAWTARLSWLDRMDNAALPGAGNWRKITKEDRSPLLKILENNASKPANTPICVSDFRITEQPNSPPTDRDTKVLLVLPHREWMKNRIQERLKESVNNNGLCQNGTLVVGDIISEEALTYLLAISRASGLLKDIRILPAQIILVTRDLRSMVLCREYQGSGLYEENEAVTAAFVSGKASWSLADYFHALRSHDGQQLWSIINDGENGPPAAFHHEWVDWHENRYLDGYLDFPATLTNPVCRAIYNLTLERLTALFQSQNCQINPLDNLVKSLVIRFRTQQRPRRSLADDADDDKPITVNVGSIRVTGSTQMDSTSSEKSPTVFHFFSHPSGESFRQQSDSKPVYCLLPWLGPLRGAPPTECIGKNQPRDSYRRIGRTPSIARGGWKEFRMPRFDKDGQSIYESTPHETYGAWQDPSRSPMKLGHWSYEGHHDLLTVNLLLAFDTELDQISFVLGGKLARFLFANLFRALGITQEHLNEEGQRLWKTIQQDGFRRLIPKYSKEQGGILVFPSHPVTDHVFWRLSSWLQDEKLQTVLTHSVPLLPLRRHRWGSGLQLSGLTIERLKAFITPGVAPPPVTYFDDAIISGHTFQQIKSLLYGLGFHEVYSLTMLDRQRLPSADHVDRPINPSDPPGKLSYRNVCYWRLDAPAMGSPAHCPLCKGLGRVKDLAEGIKSPERRQRALQWLDIWEESNPATDWGGKGLNPISIKLKKPNKKLGIEHHPGNPAAWIQAGADKKEIVLTNSAGLIAWVTELHSITARDDLAVKEFPDTNSQDLSPEVRIQLCASQLLLFHGEFDRDLEKKLGYQLALSLFNAEKDDENTALAAITLIACGNEFLTVALKELQENNRSGRSNIVTESETNLDFLTLLELNREMGISVLMSSPPPDLLTDPLRRKTYLQLQEIICSGEPGHHSSPFSRLEIVSSPSGQDDFITLEKALEACANLRQLFANIDPYWFRYSNESESLLDSFADFRSCAESRLTDLSVSIKQSLNQPQQADTPGVNKALARKVLSDGHRIALAVFTPLGLDNLRKSSRPLFMDELENAVRSACKVSRSIAIAELTTRDYSDAAGRMAREKVEYYLVWDNPIRNAVERSLTNVLRADDVPILCPWEKTANADKNQKAHLWVRLDIQEEYVQILLRNSTKMCATDVSKATKSKPWVKTFVELGGGVTYSNPDQTDGVLQASIRIPYSFFLDSPESSEQ